VAGAETRPAVSLRRLGIRDTFLALLAILDRCEVEHAFIGALPVLAWGRTRATTDIALVILAESGWDRFEHQLGAGGFATIKEVGPAEAGDPLPDIVMFRRSETGAARIDVFIAKTEFERVVVAGARTTEVLGRPVRLARPEASIIYKLIARRPKDLDDVEGIFEARRYAGEPLDWGFLEHWASEWGIEPELRPYRERFA
jgi:hypothetical protein